MEAHEGPRNTSQDNLTHWLISTQVREGGSRVGPSRSAERQRPPVEGPAEGHEGPADLAQGVLRRQACCCGKEDCPGQETNRDQRSTLEKVTGQEVDGRELFQSRWCCDH